VHAEPLSGLTSTSSGARYRRSSEIGADVSLVAVPFSFRRHPDWLCLFSFDVILSGRQAAKDLARIASNVPERPLYHFTGRFPPTRSLAVPTAFAV